MFLLIVFVVLSYWLDLLSVFVMVVVVVLWLMVVIGEVLVDR